MSCTGVKQSWTGGQVLKARHQFIKSDGFFGCPSKATRDSKKKILRGFYDRPLSWVAEEVAIINGTQAKKFEQITPLVQDRVVQFARMNLNKLKNALVDQPTLSSQLD